MRFAVPITILLCLSAVNANPISLTDVSGLADGVVPSGGDMTRSSPFGSADGGASATGADSKADVITDVTKDRATATATSSGAGTAQAAANSQLNGVPQQLNDVSVITDKLSGMADSIPEMAGGLVPSDGDVTRSLPFGSADGGASATGAGSKADVNTLVTRDQATSTATSSGAGTAQAAANSQLNGIPQQLNDVSGMTDKLSGMADSVPDMADSVPDMAGGLVPSEGDVTRSLPFGSADGGASATGADSKADVNTLVTKDQATATATSSGAGTAQAAAKSQLNGIPQQLNDVSGMTDKLSGMADSVPRIDNDVVPSGGDVTRSSPFGSADGGASATGANSQAEVVTDVTRDKATATATSSGAGTAQAAAKSQLNGIPQQ